MNIGIIGYAHPFGEGMIYGAERHLWYLGRELQEMRHRVIFFTVKGCIIPGFEYVEMPIPWDDQKDIYLEAVQNFEDKKGIKLDFIYSAMASGFISLELRNNWYYAVHPYMIFHRWENNIVHHSYRFKDACGHGTVIYPGLPLKEYATWSKKHNGYLVWLGRMDHGKAPDIAIDVAKRAGKQLVLMGPAYHYPYCHERIFQHIDQGKIFWMRGVTDKIKQMVLMGAEAILTPLWHEYQEMFGIVNIEALACGVPVIGWNNVAAPSAIGYKGGEIIENGKQGFILNHNGYTPEERERTIDLAVKTIKQIPHIDRGECRALYERRFTSKLMAQKTMNYINIVHERIAVDDITGEI
jgi:glycosyltransferase involved in cell wall biosynthesis